MRVCVCACVPVHLKEKQKDVDEKQRVPHFHGDKGVLMNLNKCPVGIYHKGKTRKEQIGI